MNHNTEINEEDTMLPEYDFDYSKAIRGKSAAKLKAEGTNIVVLQPDVFEVFHDSAEVNEALRSLIAVSKLARRAKAKTGRAERKTTGK